METIEVTARWDEQGNPHPTQFSWNDHSYTVVSEGRRWESEKTIHLLCQIPDGRVFELILEKSLGKWTLGFHSPDRRLA